MKNRTTEEMAEKYKELHVILVIQGLRPHMQRLDKEVLNVLIGFMENDNVDFQLVPAHMHWRNAAERAIRTWKNNLLAGISSIDDKFPMHLWDILLYKS